MKRFDWVYTILTTLWMLCIDAMLIGCSAVGGVKMIVITTIVCTVSFIAIIWGFVQDYLLDKKYKD